MVFFLAQVWPIIFINAYLTTDHHALQSGTLHCVYFWTESVINSREVGTALRDLTSFHEFHLCYYGNALKINTTVEASLWKRYYIYEFYLQASSKRQQLEVVFVVYPFPLFFQLLNIFVAPSQILNKDGSNDTDRLALELTTWRAQCTCHVSNCGPLVKALWGLIKMLAVVF